MTVVDTSVVVDYLLGIGVADRVHATLTLGEELAAPDLLVFEVLAVLRRLTGRDELSAERAAGAVTDLGDVPLMLFSSLPLRDRAWALRENLTAADALFVALAEHLGEPLATKDAALARAARVHAAVEIVDLQH
ncbi:MAG: type II toxin-antitoxin system VapC family toxin [Solirubrobacteraceae bacterium]|nr:type II toxin-antitoxin system VapC family toxin [Solirubrobacteraceae bacterium]